MATGQVSLAADPQADGATPYFDSDGDNTAQTVKDAGGMLYGWSFHNANTVDAYVQLYDTAGTITVGTTSAIWSELVPAGTGANNRGGSDKVWPVPIKFVNSIKYACTTTPTGSTDPTTGLVINFSYA